MSPKALAEPLRSLRLSVIDGLFYGVMVGSAESYLGALAVDLGHGPAALGLLVSLPMLAGATAQLGSPLLVARLGSRQRLVVTGAIAQALSLLLLAAIAWHRHTGLALLLAAKTAFWIAGSAVAPAWNAWMGGLTEEIDRSTYFARRSGAIHVVLLVAFVLAGAWLGRMQQAGLTLMGYATLLLVAVAARLASAFALARKLDPARGAAQDARPRHRIRHALTHGHYRIAVFIAVFMMGAHLSVPFFTPYMLRHLQLGLADFAWLTAGSILAKSLVFPLCPHVTRVVGLRGVLVVSAIGISALPWLWTLVHEFGGLLVLQLWSGAVWAGFEYASLQVLLRDAPAQYEVEFFALTSSLTGVLQLVGAMVGSVLLVHFGYEDAFIASTGGRLASLLLLVPLAREIAIGAPLPTLITRVVGVRPGQGAENRLAHWFGQVTRRDGGPKREPDDHE